MSKTERAQAALTKAYETLGDEDLLLVFDVIAVMQYKLRNIQDILEGKDD